MLTPEQIDAALGALQRQIDDLRADGEPEPAEPTVRCGNCNAILTSPLDHYPTCPPPGQCTACNSEPAYWRWRKPWDASAVAVRRLFCGTCHPTPARRWRSCSGAVKQAGERLAELEEIHADCTPPEGSVGHDFLCDRLDAIEKGLGAFEGKVIAMRARVGDLEMYNAKSPDANDFPPIATQEQVAAAYADRFAVAPSLKQRFSDWIDARTAQGVETYGQPLQTDNGRDAERDAFQELLDFCQYQEQDRMELLAKKRSVCNGKSMRCRVMMPYKEPGRKAAWNKAQRDARRTAGLCTRCGKHPAARGYSYCASCVIQHRGECWASNLRRQYRVGKELRDAD